MYLAPEVLKTVGYRLSRSLVNSFELEPEEKLWRGVLINAIEDTLIKHSDRKNSVQKGAAHNWIISNCDDFKNVCEWGNLDCEDVHSSYTLAIKEKKIQFTVRQVMWNKYDKFSKSIQAIKESRIKRQYKGKIRQFRREVVASSTDFVSTLYTTVIC